MAEPCRAFTWCPGQFGSSDLPPSFPDLVWDPAVQTLQWRVAHHSQLLSFQSIPGLWGALNFISCATNTWIWPPVLLEDPDAQDKHGSEHTGFIGFFGKLLNVNTARQHCAAAQFYQDKQNPHNLEGAAVVGSSSAALAPSLTHTHPHHPHTHAVPPWQQHSHILLLPWKNPTVPLKNPHLWKSWRAQQILQVSSSSLAQFQTCGLTWVSVPLLRWVLHRLQRAQNSCPLPGSAVPKCLRPSQHHLVCLPQAGERRKRLSAHSKLKLLISLCLSA